MKSNIFAVVLAASFTNVFAAAPIQYDTTLVECRHPAPGSVLPAGWPGNEVCHGPKSPNSLGVTAQDVLDNSDNITRVGSYATSADNAIRGELAAETRGRKTGDARLGSALDTERDTRIRNDRVLGGMIADEAGARVAGDRAVAIYAEELTEAEEIARIEADLAEASARYEADLREAKARIAAIATEKAERQAANVAQDKAVAADQYRQDVAIQNNYSTNVRQDAAISGNTTRIQNLESDVRGLEGGVALGIAAASHHYDGGYRGVQGSLAGGYYEGANAVSLGLGGNIGKRTFLNANVGTTSRGSFGAGAAIGWKF